MPFSPQRITIQGNPVTPPELPYDELSVVENWHALTTLQRWLGLDPVTGEWDQTTRQRLDQFRQTKGLTQDPETVTMEVWNALEEKFWSLDTRSREKQYYAPVTEKTTLPDELITSLSTLGIQVSSEEQLPEGVQLFKALLRRIHRFETEKSGNPYSLYPSLKDASIQVSNPVWRGFQRLPSYLK